MAGLERFDDRVWDRLFDFITPDVEQMSESEVDAELQRAGIDITAALARVTEALEARGARESLQRARTERVAAAHRVGRIVVGHIDDARKKLADMIAARVPLAQRPVFHNKLAKVATDADIQSLLEDLQRLEALDSGGADDEH